MATETTWTSMIDCGKNVWPNAMQQAKKKLEICDQIFRHFDRSCLSRTVFGKKVDDQIN